MNYYLTIGLCVLYIFLNILQVVEYERENSFFVGFFFFGGGGGGVVVVVFVAASQKRKLGSCSL